jgi:hypothetical protein
LGKLTNAVLELSAVAAKIKEDKHKTLADKLEADLAKLKVQDKAAYEALVKRL